MQMESLWMRSWSLIQNKDILNIYYIDEVMDKITS